MTVIGQNGLFKIMHHSLRKDQKRIEVSADNLAHSSMPNEKTRRIKESNLRQTKPSFSIDRGPALTNARHIQGRQRAASDDFKVVSLKHDKNQQTISGNSIDPQEELREVNEAYNQSYEMLTQHKNWTDKLLSAYNFLK